MYNSKKALSIFVAVIFTSTTVGCGQAFKGATGTGTTTSSSQSVNIDNQLQKAADASAQAQQAMVDAQAAVATLLDSSGNLNLSLFGSSSSSQTGTSGLLQPLIDKLNGVFDQVFAKINTVKAQFTAARTALASALAQLSAADPTQAAQIAMIQAQLAKVDALETQFQTMVHSLADKLDLVSAALDKAVNSATSLIPGWGVILGIAVDMFVLSDVKNLISSLKARLLAV
jgi:hypothetical protein